MRRSSRRAVSKAFPERQSHRHLPREAFHSRSAGVPVTPTGVTNSGPAFALVRGVNIRDRLYRLVDELEEDDAAKARLHATITAMAEADLTDALDRMLTWQQLLEEQQEARSVERDDRSTQDLRPARGAVVDDAHHDVVDHRRASAQLGADDDADGDDDR
jgi:hypothetical protein